MVCCTEVDSRRNVYLARYFYAVDKDRLLTLVALLEVVPPDGPAHRAAVAFLYALRLGDITSERAPRLS
jgi:hypothetical protein